MGGLDHRHHRHRTQPALLAAPLAPGDPLGGPGPEVDDHRHPARPDLEILVDNLREALVAKGLQVGGDPGQARPVTAGEEQPRAVPHGGRLSIGACQYRGRYRSSSHSLTVDR